MIMPALPRSFYLRDDVVLIARELLGKTLFTQFGGEVTSGIITETEAYNGIIDKASHAYGNRLTSRTEVMYREGGIAYIYLCYGIHSLFNIVTNVQGIPHAVLIRGIHPVEGKEIMLRRTGKTMLDEKSGIGPGKVSGLLGLHFSDSGKDLCHRPGINESSIMWLEDSGYLVDSAAIRATPRIGVDYAGEDALLPYRFLFRFEQK